MPNEDELRIFAVAAIDRDGEYCLQREWNKRWGTEYANMRSLETGGFMQIKSAGRVPLTNQWFRRSVITDAGRMAFAALKQ